MAILIEERFGVHIEHELFAANISIRANPVDESAGSVSLDLFKLEYWDGEFRRMDSIGTVGETVADFASRTFEVNGKSITGMDVALLIKQYVNDLNSERGG